MVASKHIKWVSPRLTGRKKAKLVSCRCTPNVRSGKKKSRLPWQSNIIEPNFMTQLDISALFPSEWVEVSATVIFRGGRKWAMEKMDLKMGWCACVCVTEREREIMHISIKESNRLCKSVGRICMTHVIYTWAILLKNVNLWMCHSEYRKPLRVSRHPWSSVIAGVRLGCHPSLSLSCQPWYCQCINHQSPGCFWVPRQQGKMTLEVMHISLESAEGLVSF